jgi:hypothetical protein
MCGGQAEELAGSSFTDKDTQTFISGLYIFFLDCNLYAD